MFCNSQHKVKSSEKVKIHLSLTFFLKVKASFKKINFEEIFYMNLFRNIFIGVKK